MITATLTGAAPSSPFTVTISLPTSLRDTHGISLVLKTAGTSTVSELKTLIASVTGMSANLQQLTFGSTVLTNGAQTLAGAGVSSGSTISLGDGSVSTHVKVQVPTQLQSKFGATITIPTGTASTVGSVRTLAAQVLGLLRPSDLSLSYGGARLLTDGSTLATAGVLNGATIAATLTSVRDDLLADAGTPLVGSDGKDTRDVAISGSNTTDGTPIDINLDGYPDIVLAVAGGPNLIYYGKPPPNLGDFTGVVGTPIGAGSDPIQDSQSVALIDVDGDGDTDAVFGNADGTTTTYYNDGGTLTLTPNASPPPPPNPPPPPRKGSQTSVGNLGQTGEKGGEGSGTCVGLVSDQRVYSAARCGESGSSTGWDEQSGKGPPALPAPATDADIYATHLADLNGDGIDDLIVLTHGGQHSYVYLNPGNGDFSGVTGIPIGTGGRDDSTDTGFSTSVAVADVNRDGIVDLVIGNDGTSNMIYLGVAAPTRGDFSGVVGLPFGSANGPTTDVAVGDVDGDGAMDIATANDGGPNVMYWGDPTMAVGGKPDYARLPINSPLGGTSGNAPWPWSTIGTRADGSTSIALGDLDKDGDLECVAVHAASNARARAIPLLALDLCDLVVLRHAPPRPAMVHGSDARLPSMAYAFYLAPAASWLAIREAHPAVCTSTTHTTPPSPSPAQSPSSYRRLSMHHTAPASFLPCQAPRPSLR